MIDLSERILQPPRMSPPPAARPSRWHPLRRALQVLCGILLIVLPLTNGLRLDVRCDTFYFAWHRMAVHDLVLLFWVAMLGVWALVSVSFLYGRLWCGWVCPQTLASDFADSLKARLEHGCRRVVAARAGKPFAQLLAHTLWVGILLLMSVGTGLVLASYWLAPHTVAHAALHPLSDKVAALTVYGIAAVLAADMLWVRRKFCAHACPYGPLMGLLADKNTLAVRYLNERDDDCIRCGQCVTVCPMGIDIKRGAGQVECIGCGECVDACSDVLGRRGVPGLIEFRYGLSPERQTRALTVAQRWGLWDKTRLTIVGTLFVFLGVVVWQIVGHAPLAASVIANGAITRDLLGVRNTYSLTIANGTPDTQTYALTEEGLRGGHVQPPTVTLQGRDRLSLPVTVSVPPTALAAGRRVPLQLRVRSGREQTRIHTFFYAPLSGE